MSSIIQLSIWRGKLLFSEYSQKSSFADVSTGAFVFSAVGSSFQVVADKETFATKDIACRAVWEYSVLSQETIRAAAFGSTKNNFCLSASPVPRRVGLSVKKAPSFIWI